MAVRIESQAEPIPGYRLLERLGGGGFGEVWKAEAPGGLLKAIKFVYGDLQTVDDVDAARAEQELKALSRVKAVRHPFILSLERYDIIDGQLIIVSELADRNLWDRFRECRSQGLPGIPRAELLRYLSEVAEALDHMNLELDLMHLDIKPQNLFLVQNHIKVADFGLVKDLEGLVASVTGGVTPVYAAPETFEGYVSRFSDQYSLSIVYQELLTGQRPFQAANTRQLIVQHLQAEPELSPLPPGDRPLIARALAKDPNRRFPNSQTLLRALCQVVEQQARPDYVPELQDTPFGANTTLPPGSRGRDSDEEPLHPQSSVPLTALAARTLTLGGKNGERPVEDIGEGALVPALVIGLGQAGRIMLERLRQTLNDRHGDLHNVPHLRLLAIDSDTETPPPRPGVAPLTADETLTAPLSRPSRYLRARDSLPPLDDWLHPKMVYRIPRDLHTQGIRALGRLAFIDNYRTIIARLRWDLELITAKDALKVAAERTGQKLRSSWPRIYILTGLGGGTGSGMFLDLAFNARALLLEMGLPRQDVFGFLLVPPAEEQAGRELSLANTYAALTELGYFMSTPNRFKTRYAGREPPLELEGGPFARCFLMPLENEDEPAHLHEVAAVTGDWLYRELMTPLGRAADDGRSPNRPRPGRRIELDEEPPPPYETFGIHVLGLPRREMFRRAARLIGQTFAVQWAGKHAPELAGHFRQEMQQYCRDLRMDPAAILKRLVAVCTEALTVPPDVAFAQWLVPFQKPSSHGIPEPKLFGALFKEADRLLGVYDPKNEQATQAQTLLGDSPALLPAALREAADKLANSGEPVLIQRVLQYFEMPGFRLSASEEAIDQTVAVFEEWLTNLEQQQQVVATKLSQLLDPLKQDLGECERMWVRAQHGTRPTPAQQRFACSVVPERIQHFGVLRYQYITLQWALTVYRSLRGRLSDQKKELGFCRNRLRDLQRELERLPQTLDTSRRTGRTWLLPARCQHVDDAVDAALRLLTPDDWTKLDERMQRAIQQELISLHRVCLMAGHMHFERLQNVMMREVERFLGERLQFDDAAALFLALQADEASLGAELETLHEYATPELLTQGVNPLHAFEIIVAPDSIAGKTITDALRERFPDSRAVLHADPEEITVYREAVGIGLYDLPQLGPAAKRAYESACAAEHFTPHSRLDIKAWAVTAAVKQA